MNMRRGMDGLDSMRDDFEALHRKEKRRLEYELDDLTADYRRQQTIRSEREESL